MTLCTVYITLSSPAMVFPFRRGSWVNAHFAKRDAKATWLRRRQTPLFLFRAYMGYRKELLPNYGIEKENRMLLLHYLIARWEGGGTESFFQFLYPKAFLYNLISRETKRTCISKKTKKRRRICVHTLYCTPKGDTDTVFPNGKPLDERYQKRPDSLHFRSQILCPLH